MSQVEQEYVSAIGSRPLVNIGLAVWVRTRLGHSWQWLSRDKYNKLNQPEMLILDRYSIRCQLPPAIIKSPEMKVICEEANAEIFLRVFSSWSFSAPPFSQTVLTSVFFSVDSVNDLLSMKKEMVSPRELVQVSSFFSFFGKLILLSYKDSLLEVSWELSPSYVCRIRMRKLLSISSRSQFMTPSGVFAPPKANCSVAQHEISKRKRFFAAISMSARKSWLVLLNGGKRRSCYVYPGRRLSMQLTSVIVCVHQDMALLATSERMVVWQ